jgi:ABC-type amino acid transport system permease subunit
VSESTWCDLQSEGSVSGSSLRMRRCARFEKIGLAVCARRLVPLVNQLCKVLKESALNSRVLEICWHEDFAEGL